MRMKAIVYGGPGHLTVADADRRALHRLPRRARRPVHVGAGPIGLATMLTSGLLSPAAVIMIDPSPVRREIAGRRGATRTCAPDEAEQTVADLTGGRAADVVVEAVGSPSSFELATRLVRSGGHVANVGVHGAPASLPLESLWSKNVTITTGLVDGHSTRRLLDMIAARRLDPSTFVTHHFAMADMLQAWETFAQPETGAVKIAISRT